MRDLDFLRRSQPTIGPSAGRLLLRLDLLLGMLLVAVEAGIFYRVYCNITSRLPRHGLEALVYRLAGDLVEPFRSFDTSAPLKTTGMLDLAAIVAVDVYLLLGLALIAVLAVLGGLTISVRLPSPQPVFRRAGRFAFGLAAFARRASPLVASASRRGALQSTRLARRAASIAWGLFLWACLVLADAGEAAWRKTTAAAASGRLQAHAARSRAWFVENLATLRLRWRRWRHRARRRARRMVPAELAARFAALLSAVKHAAPAQLHSRASVVLNAVKHLAR